VNVGSQRDQIIINTAGFLRSLSVGLMGVVLGIYLSRIGYSAFKIGAVVAIGLVGSAVATASVGLAADRVGRKRTISAWSFLQFTCSMLSRISGPLGWLAELDS